MEISPIELKARLDRGDAIRIVDVREEAELKISRLDHIYHAPMSAFSDYIQHFSKDETIVVVCRSGNRSLHVTRYLHQLGFTDTYNLSTGMNGWARDVDEQMQTY